MRKVKTISFNLVSEYDSRLLEYAEQDERGNFSQYIKRLIDEDMRGVSREINIPDQRPVESRPSPSVVVAERDDDREAMSGFL